MPDLFGDTTFELAPGIYVDPEAKQVYLSGERLGEWLGLSPMTVSRWAREKGLPRNSGPKRQWLYPVSHFARWILLQQTGTSKSESEARTELAIAQRKRAELDIAERQGDVVPVELHHQVIAAIGLLFREVLSELPDLLGGTDRILATRIEHELVPYRSALAKRVGDVVSRSGYNRAVRHAAAAADSLRVAGADRPSDASGKPKAGPVAKRKRTVSRGGGKGARGSDRARGRARNTRAVGKD